MTLEELEKRVKELGESRDSALKERDEAQNKLKDAIKTRDSAKEKLAAQDEKDKKIQELEATLTGIKEKENQGKKSELEGAGQYEEAMKKVQEDFEAKMNAQNEKFNAEKEKWAKQEQALFGGLAKTKIQNAIVTAASSNSAYNPNQVMLSLDRAFTLDPETFEPVPDEEFLKVVNVKLRDDDGNVRDLGGIVSAFLEGNPNLVNPQGATGGAGSKPGKANVRYQTGSIREIPSDPVERQRMHEDLQRQAKEVNNGR